MLENYVVSNPALLIRSRLELLREAGQADAWIDLIQAPEDSRVTRTLQQCTYEGKPFGSDEFVHELETGSSGSRGPWEGHQQQQT
jgi:hypothetical protein